MTTETKCETCQKILGTFDDIIKVIFYRDKYGAKEGSICFQCSECQTEYKICDLMPLLEIVKI